MPARRAGAITHITAIDLSVSAVRVVEVEWPGGGSGDTGARVLRRGAVPLPPNAWHNLSAQREAVVSALRAALAAAGSTAKSVVACLPRHLLTLRFVQLPPGAPDQMRGMVMFEAQQYIPFPLEEVVLDYCVVSEPNWGMAPTTGESLETVLIAAARRPLIEELVSIFDQAGLTLERLSVSALALAENARDALEPTALIVQEPDETEVVAVANGRLLFTRAAALNASARPEVAAVRMVDEIVRSFAAYQSEVRQHPLAHVYLAGASATGAESETLLYTLSETLEMPVARLHNSLVPAGDPEAPAYATAIGLAMQAQGPGLAPINLVPQERAERRALEARRRTQSLMGVAAAALCVVAVFWSMSIIRARRDRVSKEIKANTAMTAVTDQQDQLQKTYDKLASLGSALNTGLDRSHPVVDVLVALNMARPKSTDIWLTQFEFNRGGQLTVRGNTHSALAATDLVIRLQQSGAFSDVRLTYLGDAQENNLPSATPRPAAPTAAPKSSGSSSTPAPLPFEEDFPSRKLPTLGTFVRIGYQSVTGPAIRRPALAAPTASTAPAKPAVQTLKPAAPATPGRVPAAPAKPAVQTPKSAAPQTPQGGSSLASGTLTSFVITCQINPSTKDLLPSAPPAASQTAVSRMLDSRQARLLARARTAFLSGDTHAQSE
jgi:Tfp pilus assembly PilM family ATPase